MPEVMSHDHRMWQLIRLLWSDSCGGHSYFLKRDWKGSCISIASYSIKDILGINHHSDEILLYKRKNQDSES